MSMYKVLLVDDSPVVRSVVAGQLQMLNINPDLCEDGLQAVHACRENQYDLIFMDVMMPHLDGIEATKQIRLLEKEDHRGRTPIIGVTGYTDRASCIGAGMDDFLFKPVSLEQLRGVVKMWMPESDVPLVSNISNMFSDAEVPTQSDLADKRISELKLRLGFPDASVQSL